MSDAEHGTGYYALLGRGAVRGPHQAPVWLVVKPLQHLYRLTPPYSQLRAAAITSHKVMDDHGQLTATRELERGSDGEGEREGWRARERVMEREREGEREGACQTYYKHYIT